MKSIYLVSAATLAVMTSSPAWAQDEQPGQTETAQTETGQPATTPRGFEEQNILVTAQRREQRLQDVPVAVSAFNAGSLDERAILDVSQLSAVAPNVTFDGGTPFSGSDAVLAAYIRGIGANDFAFNIDPGVGIYLDGVYLARTVGANQDLLDVERVEVLRGPQGTLFGRNTIGGAVSIVTRAPGDTFRFRGDITTGSFDRIQVRASVDLPVSDSIRTSLSGSLHMRDGYVRRIPYPDPLAANSTPFTSFTLADYQTSDDEGDTDFWNLRGRVDFDNGGAFRATFTGDYSKQNSAQIANAVLATTEFIPGPFAGLNQFDLGPAFGFPVQTALDVITGSSGFLFAGLYNFCISASPADLAARNAANLCGGRSSVAGFNTLPPLADPLLGGVNFPGNPAPNRLPLDSRWVTTDIDSSYAAGPSFSDLETWGVAGTIEFDLNENLMLKSITAYRELHWEAGMDLDNSPLQLLSVSFIMNQWQFSQELQLLGNLLDNRLNFVLGGYYFEEAGDLRDLVPFVEGLLQVDGPNDLATTNYAFFGQVDWRIADWLGVTVGGRYTHENKDFEGGQSDLNGFNYRLFNCFPPSAACAGLVGFPDPTQPLRYFPPGVQEKSFNNFSPRAGVQIYATDDIMIYGSWSRGYKTGGWTTRLSNPLPTAPDFDEEKAESFEVGIKSTLWDRRLVANFAVFTTDYSGIQLNFQQGVSPTIQNAGDARIRGAELELSLIPNNTFRVDAAFGMIDAEYTSVLPQSQVAPSPLQAGVFPGADLPKTPNFTMNLSPRVRLGIGGWGDVTVAASYTYTTALWNDTERTFLLERESTHNVNVNVTVRPLSDRWHLTLGVTNLLDQRYLITGQAQIAGGLIYGTYSRPTEWYARVGVEF
ncbi:MAG: TonB-dependent receptor [Allosphingosinicella sp.]